MQSLGVASKLNADWEFLTHLRDDRPRARGGWLAARYEQLNVESTIDIRDRYL